MNKPMGKKAKAVAALPPKSALLKPHELVMSPTIQNAVGMCEWSKFAGTADLEGMVKDLRDLVKDVADGNMRPVEAMLIGQAMSLQTIFTSLSRRAAQNESLSQFQVNLSLALKAQAQCRTTLEALAEIKNPRPVAFVKQANITSGPQQINYGTASAGGSRQTDETAHAGQNAVEPNELLERPHGNDLDTRAQSKAGRANPQLEPVEAGYRAAHS